MRYTIGQTINVGKQMSDFQLGDLVWIISFEEEEEYFLLAKQTITELLDGKVECEDDFNTFHVAYEDIYRSKDDALNEMIKRLSQLRDKPNKPVAF